ncbi:MAG: integrase/recombinase XerC [Flavobacteriaceae bacterium]|jgi:integrase/recombinase XerC
MAIAQFISYLKIERNYASNTLLAYEKDLRSFENFCIREFELLDVSHASYSIIRSWIVALVDQTISHASINRKISSLKAYFKFLKKAGVIDKNPLAAHKSLKVKKKIAVPFSEQEMQAVFSELGNDDSFEGTRDRLIFELLYATGMRRAELIALQPSDFDLSNTQVKVLGKRNKERIIPLIPSLAGLVEDYIVKRAKLENIKDSSSFFLLNSGKKLYETFVYRLINHYFSFVSTKLKKSPHMLRHTFATHLLNRGADMQAVKDLLGHASLASTQVYTHNNMATLKKAYLASHPRNKSK